MEVNLIIKSIIASGMYKNNYLIGTQESVRWIPILQCWQEGGSIGLAENGEWVVELATGLDVLKEDKSFIRVKVLLERPLSEIHEELKSFFALYQINVDIDEIFPYDKIIKATLEDDSLYWTELAFAWYDELPDKKRKLLKNTLSLIVEKKLANQKLRHKAMKELARLSG